MQTPNYHCHIFIFPSVLELTKYLSSSKTINPHTISECPLNDLIIMPILKFQMMIKWSELQETIKFSSGRG